MDDYKLRELHSRDLGRLNKFTKSPPPLPSLICTWTVIFFSSLPPPIFSSIPPFSIPIYLADASSPRTVHYGWLACPQPRSFSTLRVFSPLPPRPPSTPNLRKIKKMVEKLENDGKILEKEKNIEIIRKKDRIYFFYIFSINVRCIYIDPIYSLAR